jgi:hypothetical protein
MSGNELPNSVRYVKNGRGGRWWASAQKNSQIHAGWKAVPDDLLRGKNLPAIESLLREQYGDRPGAQNEVNQLKWLLESPSGHVWVTFEDGFLWWCTARDGITTNPEGETSTSGHFWLACARPWSNTSLNGKLLAKSELPGTVTSTAGFRATVCIPRDWEAILRLVKGETNKYVVDSASRRKEYERAVCELVQRLSPQDFEQLVNLILARTDWERIAPVGGVTEGVDIEAENAAADERAFVQVKSSAGQPILDKYVQLFQQRREHYARMIFAVHTPDGDLTAPRELPVQVWTGEKVANLVVRVGLGGWLESRLP